jgi:hypothetical protein
MTHLSLNSLTLLRVYYTSLYPSFCLVAIAVNGKYCQQDGLDYTYPIMDR